MQTEKYEPHGESYESISFFDLVFAKH